MKVLPSRIVNARKRARLTQRDLAEALNVTVQAVSQWENGKTDPSSRLEALAHALKVQKDELTGFLNDHAIGSANDKSWSGNIDIIDIEDLDGYWSSEEKEKTKFRKLTTQSTTMAKGVQFGIRLKHRSDAFYPGDILIFDEGIIPKPGDYGAMLVLGVRGRIIFSNNNHMQFRGVQGLIVRFSEGPLEIVEPDPKAISPDLLQHAEDGPMVCVGTLVERRTFRVPA